MILRFPNQETLRLALTSGIVPVAVSLSPAAAAFDDRGVTWVQADKRLARADARKLAQLGVEVLRQPELPLDQRFCCWLQLLPLNRQLDNPIGENTPVLFELQDESQLAEIVDEMLRLGNDRQSFRQQSNGRRTRTLLRVVGPPYYSLLRAGEHAATGTNPRAYVERNARVWVELGYDHEFAGRIQPPPGKMLLMRPPRQWQFIDQAPFRDIYDVLEFQLSGAEVAWSEAKLDQQWTVPLRLAPSGGSAAAELWVLRDEPLDQVERLVQGADDELLSRLAFAVAENRQATTVVLRVRPSRKPPPVLVPRGVAFRSYLKLPNLFVPVDWRLHPPLRRDAVAKLLAQDRRRITWLYPGANGSFTPESLPDSAFRPLENWVYHVIDREHEALAAWQAAHHFEFEAFVCRDDQPARQRAGRRQPAKAEQTVTSPSGSTIKESRTKDTKGAGDNEALPEFEQHEPLAAPAEPSRLRLRLRELERRFNESDAPLDSPRRAQLWRELAATCGALHYRHDSTVCWSNALWELAAPPVTTLAEWLRCERGETAGQAASGASLEIMPDSESSESQATNIEEFDRLLRHDSPQPGEAAGIVAAYLVWASHQQSPPPRLAERLGVTAQFLERNERQLPVRTAWLAWVALARLSSGDVLSLARARDRILQRLYEHGLRPEFDLPTFLRIGDAGGGERLRLLRDRVLRLRDAVAGWINEPIGSNPRTGAYADLVFAYTLAQMGEASHCQRLAAQASEALSGNDAIHCWVREAYQQRIDEALAGEPTRSRLSDTLLSQLDAMDRLDRYKIDRLRQHSRILEPHERIDPYRRWHRRYADEMSRQLAELADLHDRRQLKQQLAVLLNQSAAGKQHADRRIQILTTALELSPRFGEAVARQFLDMVLPALSSPRDVIQRALLLEKALLIAGHYGLSEHVQALIGELEKSLPQIVSLFLTLRIASQPENKEQFDTLESLLSESFHGLRRLGMRDQIGRLLGRVAAILHHAKQARRARRRKEPEMEPNRTNLLLLIVAGGWYYFGQNEQADQVVDEVRKVLIAGDLPAVEQKNLACSYVQAVGHAPIESALTSIEELFQFKKSKSDERKLSGIKDNMATSSHFSISQLDLIQEVALALVGNGFTLNAEIRRWIDEDEFLVRRRIHRDVREATG